MLNSKFSKITSYLTDCSGAEGLKVDHHKNLWVACTNTGTVNMYAPGATSATMVLNDNYNLPAGYYFYTADVAVTSAGNVFASSLYAFYCTSVSCFFVPGQVSYWTNPTNGASPTGQVADANINQEAFFLDTDAAGQNLYVDYYGCTNTYCGYGLDAIGNPTGATDTVTNEIAVNSGALQFPGGVYVLHKPAGTVAVNDQVTHLITVYQASPWTALAQLGPTPTNIFGSGDAVTGIPNKKDTGLALGDASLHAADLGKVASNSWNAVPNINFSVPIGAGYIPSDK